MNLSEAVRQMLTDAGVSSVYIIDCPDDGSAVLVMPYMSRSYDGVPVGEQRFQIYCAAGTFPESESLAWQAFYALEGKAPPACDREVLGFVRALQEPFFLDKDPQGRYIHEFNIAVSAVWKENENV